MSEANNNIASLVLAIIIAAIIIGGAIYFGLRYQADVTKNQAIVTNPEKNLSSVEIKNQETNSKNISSANTEDKSETSNSNSLNNSQKGISISAKSDEELIREALIQRTGISKNNLEFEIASNNGIIARGTVKNKNEMAGAGWFAHKSNNIWIVTYVGQGVPRCSEVNPYNYPIAWADYCIDSQGRTVHR